MRISRLQVLLLLALTTSAFSFRLFKFQHNEEGQINNYPAPKDGPSPMDCTICTALVLLSENYAVSHNVSVDDFIENKLCGFFKEPLLTFCENFVQNYGPAIINSLKNDTSPDDACKNAALCLQNSTCILVPKNQTFDLKFRNPDMTPNPYYNKGLTWDPWQEFLKIIEQFANNHRPDVDLDNDTFSQYDATARGYDWKGKDCNDLDASIYPGQSAGKDPASDYNCNGIDGRNESNGVTWKDQLCNNTGQIGFAVIGDSVGAHFEMPPQWFNASMWNDSTFDDFVPRGLDEFDLPQYSGWTGHLNRTDGLPSNSIYKYLFQQNHCNMRDYQNAGVNGCDSNLEQSYIRDAFRRTPTDEPVIVILELVGNDVCHNPQFMTSVAQFQINILNLLDYLDTILPPGSHVMSVGLVDGRVLWDVMSNRTHPLGVTYADLYDYMVCQNISPCPGWMNSNQTIRNATSARAAELNQVYQEIVASGQTWKNFDYVYYDFPDEEIMAEYTIEGGEPYQLIEPVDGFHPNQIFHSMIGDYFWNILQKNHSNWIGQPNPNNQLIAELFGDQGGY